MQNKSRVTISVDPDLAEAGQAAVASGRAGSVSAWINQAIRRQVEHDRRLEALGAFVAAYEAAEGEITDIEIAAATRRARERALVVRGRPRRRTPQHDPAA